MATTVDKRVHKTQLRLSWAGNFDTWKRVGCLVCVCVRT